MELTKDLVQKHVRRLVEAKVTVRRHIRHSTKGTAFNVGPYDREYVKELKAQIAYEKKRGDPDNLVASLKDQLIKVENSIPDTRKPEDYYTDLVPTKFTKLRGKPVRGKKQVFVKATDNQYKPYTPKIPRARSQYDPDKPKAPKRLSRGERFLKRVQKATDNQYKPYMPKIVKTDYSNEYFDPFKGKKFTLGPGGSRRYKK